MLKSIVEHMACVHMLVLHRARVEFESWRIDDNSLNENVLAGLARYVRLPCYTQRAQDFKVTFHIDRHTPTERLLCNPRCA